MPAFMSMSGPLPLPADPAPSADTRAEGFMRLALGAAEQAASLREVPVGAVVVVGEEVVAVAHNERETLADPTAHAEIVALRRAAEVLRRWRLTDAELYVTMEPCPMCAGAMIHARVARVVFGAPEPRAGALVSACRAHETAGLNHRLDAEGGVLEDECRAIIQGFFEERRGRRSESGP